MHLFSLQIYPKDEQYIPAQTAIVTCESTGGYPEPSLTWYKDGEIFISGRPGADTLILR